MRLNKVLLTLIISICVTGIPAFAQNNELNKSKNVK